MRVQAENSTIYHHASFGAPLTSSPHHYYNYYYHYYYYHNSSSSSTSNMMMRKSSTKEKRWRQREDERVEKLRLLVSYLRSGSSQQMLVKPVKLEADEIELAQRYKSMPTLCDHCLRSAELQQPIMDPMPNSNNNNYNNHHHQVGAGQPPGRVSSCSIMNLSGGINGAGGGGGLASGDGGSSVGCGLYHSGSNYSSCSRTPEIGWNQSISGCSSHKQLNASQSSVGIVINVRRSSEQSECLASASDTDSHHNQQLTSAESDQITSGSTYSGSSGSTTNLQAASAASAAASVLSNMSVDSGMHNTSSRAIAHSAAATTIAIAGGGATLPMAATTPLLASSATINGPNYNNQPTTPPSKMFYIGDYERRDGCTWTNPPNLATWIDNEVNSLVNDLEAKSQLAKSEKSMKSSKRKWLQSASSNSNNRRSSSGAHST